MNKSHTSSQRPTLLVVDDDPHWRRLLRSMFARCWNVIECGGNEACAAASAGQPDCVVLNVGRTPRDGFAAAAKIRAALQQARIVLLTEDAEEEYPAWAAASGSALVGKDDMVALRSLVENAVPGLNQRHS